MQEPERAKESTYAVKVKLRGCKKALKKIRRLKKEMKQLNKVVANSDELLRRFIGSD